MADRANGQGVLTEARRSTPGSPGGARAERLPRLRRPRRPLTAAAGAVLITVCAVTAGVLYTGASRQLAVLALAHPVSIGQPMTAADLRVAHLSGSGLNAIPASAAARLVGRTLTADLPAGTLLETGMLTAAGTPTGDQEVVGVALKPGSLPGGELAAGDRVAVLQVATNTGGGSASPGGVLVPAALVLSVQPDPTSDTTLVDLAVGPGQAVSVASAAAAGTVSLALLAGSGS
ncbi:MAG TPA: SAF domain-containing protein [Mycobacteriales bacterium]|nr:SAF domain-containing protein [Mycobacteriales bacterium]